MAWLEVMHHEEIKDNFDAFLRRIHFIVLAPVFFGENLRAFQN